MELSFSTCIDYDVGIDDQVAIAASAGFTHVSPTRPGHAGYLEAAGRKRLGRLLSRYGLQIESIHAPSVLGADGTTVFERVITAASELGVELVVVHVTPWEVPDAEAHGWGVRAQDLCQAVEPAARRGDVRVALENLMPGAATTIVTRVLESLDPEVFGFCYDSSHGQVDGPRPVTLPDVMRERLDAVHLSDRSAPFVDHLPPGDGFIDWAAVRAALQGAGYVRPLLLELIKRGDEPLYDFLLRSRNVAEARIA